MSAASVGPVSALDTLLIRLAKRTGVEPAPLARIGGYQCDCPVGHPSTPMALHVRRGRDGRIVLSCKEGCHPTTIAAALGMRVEELFPQTNAESPSIALVDDAERLPRAIRAIDAPEPEPITWCVDELLIAGELAVFAGDGGSYKSTTAFHIAGAVAGGYSAFNRFPTRQRPALILSAEDGAGVVLNRLDALVTGHGWDRERVLTNVHILATHEAKLSSPEWQQHLLAECARLDAGYVLFDPWADLISGDENSNSEQRPIIQFCRRVATQTGAAVVVNAHASKAKEGQRAIDRVRGASALRDASRCVLFFESRPEGIAVEHLKMSRSEKLEPFMLTREIESSVESRAIWESARFSFQTKTDAVLSRAESFVLDQVTMSPGVLKTADLRRAAADSRIRGEDISRALSTLQARGLIDYDEGERKSKLWRPTPRARGECPQNDTDQSRLDRVDRLDFDPVHPAQTPPGRLPGTASGSTDPAHPYRVGGRVSAASPAGQGGQGRIEEDER